MNLLVKMSADPLNTEYEAFQLGVISLSCWVASG